MISTEANETQCDTAIMARCPFESDLQCRLVSMGDFIDRSGLVGKVGVARCPRCGMGISQPILPDIGFLYANRTSQDFQPGTSGISWVLKRFVFRRDARTLLTSVGAMPACVIDYGCGSGLFTRCLAEVLPKGSRVIGCDFHEDPPGALAGAEYRSFAAMDDLLGKADLVLAMHVVEHDDDPKKIITNLLRYVRPGGHVVIEVPNMTCAWVSVFGRFWDAWYLPYHRVHFTRTSLSRMIEESGLTIRRQVDISLPTMGRTAANLIGAKNSTAFILLSAVLQPLQWIVERLTGQPSALRVIAQKPSA